MKTVTHTNMKDIEDSGADIQNRIHFHYSSIDRQRQYEEFKQY